MQTPWDQWYGYDSASYGAWKAEADQWGAEGEWDQEWYPQDQWTAEWAGPWSSWSAPSTWTKQQQPSKPQPKPAAPVEKPTSTGGGNSTYLEFIRQAALKAGGGATAGGAGKTAPPALRREASMTSVSTETGEGSEDGAGIRAPPGLAPLV
mmetsp:Transcript_28832/g.74293  ORF Transcript_28832/g.74293 Transcript_28832/m.74293 type:complete len:151 (+) Transcript_28832:46-498(+)